jgi:hypothetical protein
VKSPYSQSALFAFIVCLLVFSIWRHREPTGSWGLVQDLKRR